MSAEENKAIIRRWVEELNKGNLDMADEFYAADFVLHDSGGPPNLPRGPEAIKQSARPFIAAVPDMKFTIERLVAEGDTVAGWGTLSGTHQGELAGISGTGKPVSIIMMNIARFADGKIAEEWQLGDNLTLMQQIGAIPTPG